MQEGNVVTNEWPLTEWNEDVHWIEKAWNDNIWCENGNDTWKNGLLSLQLKAFLVAIYNELHTGQFL